MLIVETIGRIRREHFVKGKSIKEIARDLRISRNTVRKVLRSGETSFFLRARGSAAPEAGSLEGRDSTGCWRRTRRSAARERLTLIRVFEELRGAWLRGRL